MSGNRTGARPKDQTDGSKSSGGFGFGMLAGIGLAAGAGLLAYGLSRMDESNQEHETPRHRNRSSRPVNDLPPRRTSASQEMTEDIPHEKRCVVCLNGEKEVIVLDCGHVCMCLDCGHQIMTTRNPKCPICRRPIDSLKKFYM